MVIDLATLTEEEKGFLEIERKKYKGRMLRESVPRHIHEGFLNFILYGIEPGSFLRAVLSNDLKESFGRADDTNLRHMFSIVSFTRNGCPAAAQGSETSFLSWIEWGGLVGLYLVNKKKQEVTGG